MAPAKFGDLGKSGRDLLGKDYPVGQVKVELKTVASGVTFTTNAVKTDDKLSGELQSKFVDKVNNLTVTSTYASDNKAKVELTLKDAVNVSGLELGSILSFKPNSNEKSLDLSVDYGRDNVRFTSNVSPLGSALASSLAFKKDNTTLGGDVKANFSGQVSDFNLGIGYADRDYDISFFAKNKLGVFVSQYQQNVRPDFSVAAIATYNKAKGNGVNIEFGGKRVLDADSSIKAKVDTNFQLGLAYSQKLKSGVTATVGSSTKLSNLGNADVRLGLTLEFSA